MEAMERYHPALDDHPMSSSPSPLGGGAEEDSPEDEERAWRALGEMLARRARANGAPPTPVGTGISAVAPTKAPASERRGALKDSVGLYLSDIRRYSLLNREQELAYARAAQSGDISARDELITRNLRLVVSIAKHYQGLGLSFSDLIEEGNLGLIRSIDRFDWTRGLRFSTYASKWIRQSITRSLVNKSRTVRIPSNVLALLKRIAQIQRQACQETGRRATTQEICETLSITLPRLAEIYGLTQSTLSLDHPIDPHIGRHRLHDIMPAPHAADPAENALKLLQGGHVAELLNELPAREERILRLRFGFDGQDPKSLEETGGLLGITRERVRQIEARALAKLRRNVQSAKLASPAA